MDSILLEIKENFPSSLELLKNTKQLLSKIDRKKKIYSLKSNMKENSSNIKKEDIKNEVSKDISDLYIDMIIITFLEGIKNMPKEMREYLIEDLKK